MRPLWHSNWESFLHRIPILYFVIGLLPWVAPHGFAAAGDIDMTFDAQLDGMVRQFSVAPDGKIVIHAGGFPNGFSTVHGVKRPGFARLLPNGMLDESFVPAAETNGFISAFAALGEQRVLLATSKFRSGDPPIRLIALSSSGAPEATLDLSNALTSAGFTNRYPILHQMAIFPLPDGTPVVRVSGTSTDWPGKLAYFAVRFEGNTLSAALTNLAEDPLVPRQGTGKTITIERENAGFYEQSTVLLRRLSDKIIDPSFRIVLPNHASISPDTQGIAVQPDDRLLIASTPFTLPSDPPAITVSDRFEADGSPDLAFPRIGFVPPPGFGAPAFRTPARVFQIQVLTGNKALVASEAASVGGTTRGYLARIDLGPLNSPQPPRFISGPESFEGLAGQEATFRVNPDAIGSLSYQWRFQNKPLPGQTDSTLVVTVGAAAEGEYAVAVTNSAGGALSAPARLTILPAASGAVDPSFNPGTGADDGRVNALLREPDGRILVGGTFTRFNGQPRPGLVRLNSNGTVDATFVAGRVNANAAPPATLTVDALARQPDGRILFGGVLQVGERARTNVYRLNSNGTLDPTFQASPAHPPTIMSLLVLPDRNLLVGGTFSYTNTQGVTFLNLVRLMPDGELDTSYYPEVRGYVIRGNIFSPSKLFPGYVRGMALDGQNRRLVAGAFEPRGLGGSFARLTEIGGRDVGFEPRLYASPESVPEITALALDRSGESALAGSFSLAGSAGSGVARFTETGRMTGMAQPITNAKVSALAFQSDGKLIVGGAFNALANFSVTNLGRLHRDGLVDRSFRGANAGPDGEITSILVEPSGAILIGGGFAAVDGVSRRSIARLYGSGRVYRELSNAHQERTHFSVSIQTVAGRRYTLEHSGSLPASAWSAIATLDGDGGTKTLIDASPGLTLRFYRVRIE